MATTVRHVQRYEATVPVEQLREHPDNPRRGDVARIDASMAAHGFYGAVIAQASTGAILAGNHRHRVAVARGERTLPVIWLDVDDDQARRILLVDNRTGDLGGYDDETLESVLRDLMGDQGDLGLLGTGYSVTDLAELFGDPEREGVRNWDEVTPYNDDPTTDDYYTPAWVFEALGLEFDLDVASPPNPPEWIPAHRFYTIKDDGLASPWDGRVWMNPPYSHAGPWMERFLDHGNGVALVAFVKSAWWRSLWASDAAIAVSPKPIDFVGGGIMFESCFVAVGTECEAALRNIGQLRRVAP